MRARLRVGEALAILQGTVFAFSMKVCGHREDAEDTMQKVPLRSLPHLGKIEQMKLSLCCNLVIAVDNSSDQSDQMAA
jgi:DNA-directed RNA polymerase specialized sigma24 family protein